MRITNYDKEKEDVEEKLKINDEYEKNYNIWNI